MRGAYRRQSARSASRRPAPPRAMAASSAVSEASAFIGRKRYHRPTTAAPPPGTARPARASTAWFPLSGAECIGQREERPSAVPLVGAAVHQPENSRLETGELLQQRTYVGARGQVRNRRVHRQRRTDHVRGAQRRNVGATRGEQVPAEERPGARLEHQATLPPVGKV